MHPTSTLDSTRRQVKWTRSQASKSRALVSLARLQGEAEELLLGHAGRRGCEPLLAELLDKLKLSAHHCVHLLQLAYPAVIVVAECTRG